MIKVMQTMTIVCNLAVLAMVAYMSQEVKPSVMVFTVQNNDTVYVEKVITKVMYRDTCDSQFMKTIAEAECGYMSKKRKGKKV